MKSIHIAVTLSALCACSPALTAPTTPLKSNLRDAALDAGARHEIVRQLARIVEDNYVFPEVAKKVAEKLRATDDKDGYRDAINLAALAKRLTKDMRETGKDIHFNVWYDPDFKPAFSDTAPNKEALAQQRERAEEVAAGVFKVERLPGNIGYIDLRGFEPPVFSAPAIDAAMILVKNTEAIVLDLRMNGGGEGETVAYLMSHFFAEGDQRHLNDMIFRQGHRTQQYWTTTAVGIHYTRPVYVLTSRRTFSAAEECAYNFQAQKRATLVGETTGGGANPGDVYPITHGLVAFVSNGQSINPVTHTNWEGVGVKPDIVTPAARALDVANAKILREIVIPKHTDPEEREYLAGEAERLEKGETKKEMK